MEDHGSPSLWSHVTITVNVLDWNTHAPIFHNLPAILNISTMTSPGIPLYQVNASDADLGENAKMNYQILAGEWVFNRIQLKGFKKISNYPFLFQIVLHVYEIAFKMRLSRNSWKFQLKTFEYLPIFFRKYVFIFWNFKVPLDKKRFYDISNYSSSFLRNKKNLKKKKIEEKRREGLRILF